MPEYVAGFLAAPGLRQIRAQFCKARQFYEKIHFEYFQRSRVSS